ncbi:MAG: bifunctional (p)ppGpp synthetase/guanosine-3',5'-bis(diphosphate) 3'-pyrophosphohydrolase [Betaproteobacteria bacterium]|nr:bifunctional (p)ppGpp synthetase/guanosine-3',5'-bis(diphosphate) 3'-pyrophosphohydrolase [Betaproteobacteria bacterium]
MPATASHPTPTAAPNLPVMSLVNQVADEDEGLLERARALAQPLLVGETFDGAENNWQHAQAMAHILSGLGGSATLQAACYLVYACDHLSQPADVLGKAFGKGLASLAIETHKLLHVQRQARRGMRAAGGDTGAVMASENVRKMLLAFSRDLRVVLLRLASRLQTLRHMAATKRPVPPDLAQETLQVFAPLANRLGIGQLKWELEDLSFRFLEPTTYREVAAMLDEKRVERESFMREWVQRLQTELQAQHMAAQVQGRPKHIYSIVKKMRGKSLPFDQVFDIRAVRVVVDSVPDCYAVLSWVHSRFTPLVDEFDDYIARPKSNGYQSLHTVVRDAQGRAIEIQIRTQAMHEHAELGVAAHWAYKEAGSRGYAGVAASKAASDKIALMRQLLAWEREMTGAQAPALQHDRIYVLTPEASVVELPVGGTGVDFAYSVHTNLGHRCRGVRVDGQMVPLSTPLQNGQTVEVIAAKEGGPSRDWLNPELGLLVSARARAKVRAWFNAQVAQETIARGREAVEKLLQREGKTATRHEELAGQLGFVGADALFEAVGKDEFSLRQIETRLRPSEPAPAGDDWLRHKLNRKRASAQTGGVLVVGIEALMTELARCCRPAPPDPICGFVTRGKGVSVHRAHCPNFVQMLLRQPGRAIEVQWQGPGQGAAVYPVDVQVQAQDRQALLRDISEVLAREKINVIGVQTQSVKGTAWMTFTVEVTDSVRLDKVLAAVRSVLGVESVRRR